MVGFRNSCLRLNYLRRLPILISRVLVMTETFFLLPEKGRHRRPFSLAVTGMCLLILVSCSPGEGTAPTTDTGGLLTTVDYVVDGDTVWVDGLDESVRLIGIDTPEVHPELECYGEEAEEQLIDLIPHGTEVEVRFDVEERDRFGRYLGYVYRVSDGLFVNLAMVEDGYAEMVRIEPNVLHANTLKKAENQAVTEGAGLWGACF